MFLPFAIFGLLLFSGSGPAFAKPLEALHGEGEQQLRLAEFKRQDLSQKNLANVKGGGEQRPLVFRSILDAGSRGGGSVGPAPQEEPVGYPGRLYSANALCRGEAGTYSVCLNLEVLEAIGHNHFEGRPGVEIIGARCKDDIPVNVWAQWDFEAPQFASKLKASWSYRGECVGEPSAQAGFGVRGLIELTPGIGYEIRKGAPMHRFNSFGSAVTINSFKKIAAEYRLEFPTAGNLAVLGVSLPWGGLYDVNSDWATPYPDHQFGFELDLDADSVPTANVPRLREIAAKYQVGIEDFGGRLLLSFPPFAPDKQRQARCHPSLSFLSDCEDSPISQPTTLCLC